MVLQTVGRFVLGLGNGAYAAGVPLYISEISPANLRGRVVGIELMILCFGEMVVFWFSYACFFVKSPDWWRLPIAIQIAPALVLAVGCWTWVPPSPRWLVAQERYDCAQEVLTRLHGSDVAEQEMRDIRETIMVESGVATPTWADMFKAPVLRVTLLGAGIQAFQQISGTNSILYYAPALFRRGGISDPAVANLATGGVGIVLFLTSWIPIFVFDSLPRKTWLQVGTVGMFGALIGIAALQRHAVDHPDDPANYTIVAFPYIFYTFFNMSWSSGSWTYAAEIFPISLRVSLIPLNIGGVANGSQAKGNALCTASLWIANFIVAQVSPPIAAAIGWGLYVIYAIICAIAFIFVRYALGMNSPQPFCAYVS
jgi:sugar porter (SP) family MFS transporter